MSSAAVAVIDQHHPSCSSSPSTLSTSSSFSGSQPSSAYFNSNENDNSTINTILRNQCWYWGNATKEEITKAMENQQDGTFAVRNASTKGQYTLTLKINGTNKLIKILVLDNKYGFTEDSMDFDSVPALIQFYRTCSLRDFNDKLDTCLLYPLASPDWLSKQTTEELNKKDTSKHINILKCQLEGYHAEYDRISRRYDQLFSQRNALNDEHVQKQKTFFAYSDALKIFERKINELRKTCLEDVELSDRDRDALAINVELQEERMEEISKAQKLMNSAIQNIIRTLSKIDEELEQLKPRLLKMHKKRDKCRDMLLAIPKLQQQMQQQVTHAQLDRLIQAVSLALDSEPASLSTFLLHTPLSTPKWDVTQWFWHQGNKDQAISTIRALLNTDIDKKDGIFLIRPSTSRPGFYALEISKDGNVHSCLIEYRDPRTAAEHSGGYGFAHTQMLFPSLVDFVRYYSVIPLKEHNSVLDTPLKTPALSTRKKVPWLQVKTYE